MSKINDMGIYIGTKHLAERLCCSQRTIYRLMKDGTIEPPKMLGGSMVWTEEQVKSVVLREPHRPKKCKEVSNI